MAPGSWLGPSTAKRRDASIELSPATTEVMRSYRRSCGSENGTRALKVSPNEMAPPTNPPTPA